VIFENPLIRKAPRVLTPLRKRRSELAAPRGTGERFSVASKLTVLQTTLLYVVAVVIAEMITTFTSPLLGTLLHAAVFTAGIIHGAVDTRSRASALWMSLSLVPLIRVVSLGLPLGAFPQNWWYVLTSIPLIAGAVTAIQVLELKWSDVGLIRPQHGTWSLTIVVGVSGLFIGFGEYVLLGPSLIFTQVSVQDLMLAVIILFIGTGVVEELIFRGILQRTATQAIRFWPGAIVVSLLFAVMHVGHGSWLNVGYIFLVAMYFALVRRQTGSLFGVILAHTLANFVLLVAMNGE
jgi:uncharacterized protein